MATLSAMLAKDNAFAFGGGGIRIIAGVRPHSRADPLFVHINILKCNDIHRFLVGHLMSCVYSGTLDFFKWYVSFKNDMHNY